MDLLAFFFFSYSTLFAIVDPPTVGAAFAAMTEGNSPEERRRMARIGSATAGGVLLFFAFGGQHLFKLLGLTHDAFQIAGGIILLLAALDMLRAQSVGVQTSPAEREAAIEKADIAITPIAIPMLAGPGAISASLVLSGKAASAGRLAALGAAIVLLTLTAYLCLRWSSALARLLGPIGIRVLQRLVGLLLAALAVQFILNGLTAYLR
ncbi:MAG: MarC family protein [bacterium]